MGGEKGKTMVATAWLKPHLFSLCIMGHIGGWCGCPYAFEGILIFLTKDDMKVYDWALEADKIIKLDIQDSDPNYHCNNTGVCEE